MEYQHGNQKQKEKAGPVVSCLDPLLVLLQLQVPNGAILQRLEQSEQQQLRPAEQPPATTPWLHYRSYQ